MMRNDSNPQTILEIPNYQIIETIYSGSRTLVYRAVRTSDQLRVIIKILRNEYPTFSELVQFRNQYTIAKNLCQPGIIQTYSLEPYQNGYALVMEDFGGISLHDWAGSGKNAFSLIEFLEIAIALCNTLDVLYRERIIHKDIKPANILINPETKQVKLIDFSIGSLLPRETQTLINPNVLEGTLAYISPEQTGRMNRGIDYRTDFYSLGVTFYELLTGDLPFKSNDPMELVHCHIAKLPPLLPNREEIPQVISDIVMKLMAKNAEDRYQSALGLKFDLENCLHQLQVDSKIEGFEIGQRDVCDRFLIPDKLYGREAEVSNLLQAFDRVSLGAAEMMLVAGFSGIGKTAVVNEVHKPIVRQRGYFIKGKYDQFQRNIPFSAFVQVFRDLMGQLLSESDAQLQTWKTKILEVLGENGQVLTDVIPELEQIIGSQPPATELSGTAAENRFNLLLQKFVQVFTNKEHPLVMFLDDLQWADSASLKLLQMLMQDTEYLLILGAYRNNEVSPTHPFILTINEIAKTGAVVNKIALQPLSEPDINQLVADTLNCELLLAQPLTKLVYQKTQGNPFFATQFLKTLNDDRLITFDPPQSPSTLGKGGQREIQGGWQCNIAQVRALAITDDVLEFMALQLQKLPHQTQNVLKLAACIGSQFDLHTLAIVSEQSPEVTAADLWKALPEGLIIPNTEIYKFFIQSDSASVSNAAANPIYRFLHDRVQQAAYFLIPDDQKQATHYQIGQLLLQQISPEARVDRIFEIVNQLNYGTALINEQTQRNELAQLNLITCRKARTGTAYQAAREYAAVGLSLLGEDAWQQQYEMTLALHELAAEVAMLCGDFETMEQFIDIVIGQAHSLLEQVNVYRIRIQAKASQRQLNEVLEIGINILQQLGANITESPTPDDIQQSIQEINELIGDRQIADFTYLPVMTDANKIAITQIASSIMAAAYTCGSLLYPLLATLLVKLFLRHGNISVSATNYACYSLVLCNMQNNIDLAAQFGQLALNVAAKFDDKASKLEVFLLLGSFILHRKSHLKEMLPFLSESYTLGLEVGNLEYAGYAVHNFCLISSWCGQPLANLEQDTRTYYHALVQLKQLGTANYCLISWQVISNLLGLAKHPTILSGSAFQEIEFLPLLQSANDICGLYIFYSYKLMLCFLFGEVEPANNYALECKNYLMSGAGTVAEPAFYFYDSLVALALLSQPSWEVSTVLERVAENQTKLQHWAHNAPMNHLHKWHLVEAEKSRVLGDKAEAIEHYDRAITLAKENKFLNEEALANELATKFYLDWGKEKIAVAYIQEAYYCYAQWGAKAKTEDLETRYPQLLATILQKQQPAFKPTETMISVGSQTIQTSGFSHASLCETLDLATILKASQLLSSEIELEKLLSTLVQVILESAGADKCALLMPRGSHWVIEALSQLDQPSTILGSLPFDDGEIVPVTLINRVKNTLTLTVIENAVVEPTLAADPYILHHSPKSIICAPIVNQGKLIGILYLENNLTVGAFTSDGSANAKGERLQVLKLLTTQAAISLENAQLYRQLEEYSHTLEQKVEERTQEITRSYTQLESTLEKLYSTQSQLIQAEKMSGLGQLVAGIAHEINNPINFIYGNLQPASEYVASLIELNNLYQELYPQPLPEIAEIIADIDLEFISDDLQKLLSSMRVGADRIRQIVLSLRNFSRLDEAEIKPVDIHSGIDSTLLILQHRLQSNSKHPEIAVIQKYGQLPLVKCHASALNQVFMNILNNAIDALEESHINRPPNITIQTEFTESKKVIIRIADNGIGISESVQNKIFNPFFTTKPVGSGTGLGLSTSYSIVVEKHQGKLSCTSALGEGTEFIIEIPV